MSKILIHTQVELEDKQVEKLLAMVDEQAAPAEKIGGLAQTALVALADGGMMLGPMTMQAIEQSVGYRIDSDEGILAHVEAGAEDVGGKMKFEWFVDPCYIETMQAQADFQGISLRDIGQRIIDTCTDSGWTLGEVIPNPERVLMSKEDKAALVEALGADFTNGTELAELLKQNLGMTSPFDETPEPAAAE